MKKFLIPLFTLFFSIQKAPAALLKAHDNTGETPLHRAARNGNAKMVQFFLRQYPSMVEKKDNYGKTPLFTALSHGHIAVAELLIRSQTEQIANIEPVAQETACGANPLHIMISLKKSHDMVRRLIDWVEKHPIKWSIETEYIIDVNGKDKHGQTPLALAYAQRDTALIKILIAAENIDLNKKNKNGHTLLFTVLSNKDLKLAEHLLNAFAARRTTVSRPCLKDSEGNTPLHVFAKNGDLDGLWSILNWHRTAEIPDLAVDAIANQNKTALYFAVINKRPNITALLAKMSPTRVLKAIDPRDRTLLFIALAYGDIEIADILFQAHTLKEVADNVQQMPFHILAAKIAIAYGFLETENILFEINNWEELKDHCQITPIHILAAKNEFSLLEPVLQWIRSRMSLEIDAQDYKMRTPLFVALLHGSTEAASLLLEHGANPQLRPKNNSTPLHYLTCKNEPQSLERVIRWIQIHHLDYTECKDEEGKTALFLALAHGHTDIADLLINVGACTREIKDLEGRNPLHYLVENRDVNGLERVLNWQKTKHLTSINICQPDDRGASPLRFAAFQPSNNYLPLIKKLIEHGAVQELPQTWHSCIEREVQKGKLIAARQTLLTAYLAVMIANQPTEE